MTQAVKTMFKSPAPAGCEANKVAAVTEQYMSYFQGEKMSAAESSSMTEKFYNLVTDFYQYGWGNSFHFAPRLRDETFRESIKRHEHFLALKLGLAPGVKCIDVGCGVGGPLVEIGGFSGASVTGVNINQYQVQKVQENIARYGLAGTCGCVKSDFMHLPFESGSLDAAYQIEATCHASDRVGCYAETARVLKDGGLYAGYEWVTTQAYEPTNELHKKIVQGIEVGNGLPPVISGEEVLKALEDAGFEVLEYADLAADQRFTVPWYEPLAGGYTLSGFRYTRYGRWFTHTSVSWAEKAKLVPKGTKDVSSLLMMTAEALVAGGEKGIFTPSFFYLARKKKTSPPTPQPSPAKAPAAKEQEVVEEEQEEEETVETEAQKPQAKGKKGRK